MEFIMKYLCTIFGAVVLGGGVCQFANSMWGGTAAGIGFLMGLGLGGYIGYSIDERRW